MTSSPDYLMDEIRHEHGLDGEEEEEEEGDINTRAGPRSDKPLNEMTIRELNYLVTHLSYKSERRQQAAAELKQRPEYLKHAKSSVFATDKQLAMKNPVLTPPRSALQSSTTPIGPPPYNVGGVLRKPISQPLPQQQSAAPFSSTGPSRSSADNSKFLIPSCTVDLAQAENLIQRTLLHSIAYQSANLPSWHAPTTDPWAIPSPVGAQVPTDYVVAPAHDAKVFGDRTAFVPEQAWLAADNLPPAMGFIQYVTTRRRRGGPPRSFTNELPASISKEVEGWRLSYWFRRFPDVELKDIAERIMLQPGQIKRTKEELKLLCNQLSMRHQRWCEREGGFMFSRTSNTKVSSRQLEIIERSLLLNGFEGLERNTIWALDQSVGHMVQPMLKGVKNFLGSRCVAPQRAVLEPRVDAAFKMYIGVVKESRSRNLADWRDLERKNWPDTNEADEQEDNRSMRDNTENDVQMPHTQTTPSVRSHTVPPNYGASFNQANTAQQFVPIEDGESFPAQQLQTGELKSNTPPPLQQQLPVSQRPQQSQLSQGEVAYQQMKNYHGQSLGPIPHGLPLQPIIDTIPPFVNTLSSTRGPMNDMRPTMPGANMAAIAVIDNGIAEMMKWYDAKQSKDRNNFIVTQNHIFNQLISQGVPWGDAYAPGQQAVTQYTEAQRKSRMNFLQAHHVRQNASRFHQNGAQSERFNHPVVVDLISPDHVQLTPATPHTPPTPSKAPNPKRLRLSTSLSSAPTYQVKPVFAAQPHEPAARKIEINEKYDEDEDEDEEDEEYEDKEYQDEEYEEEENEDEALVSDDIFA
ncbi:hypothetical protein E2P81_ATG08823 [Venturia nashicola]|uniref:Uncharacterized protein n=1 Tax=Venturia nashicola TaxID=86259 RepID=A0A4Z1P527_9PEZI|nr:hypothetical protein E6O75_ATG09018 [Venturia nashicola]TLD23479.1 hypothetical protein E2P81_ATG08823 [Venturia nashicola]